MDRKKRNQSLDILRILAIWCVMLNHTPAYTHSLRAENPVAYVLSVMLDVLIKCGPALFFMISGYLLLGRKESLRELFTKRVLRMVICILLLTGYMFVRGIHDGNETGFGVILFTRLNWYLYAYVAFLLMLPLLRTIAQHMDAQLARYYVSVVALVALVQPVTAIFGWEELFTQHMLLFTNPWGSLCWSVVCPLLGFVAKEWIIPNGGRMGWIRAGAVVDVALAVAIVWYDRYMNGASNYEQILQHLALIPCLWIFCEVGCLRMGERWPVMVQRAVSAIAAATFGVFLMECHTGFSQSVGVHLSTLGLAENQFGSSFLRVLIAWLIFTAITMVLRLIPGVNKLL